MKFDEIWWNLNKHPTTKPALTEAMACLSFFFVREISWVKCHFPLGRCFKQMDQRKIASKSMLIVSNSIKLSDMKSKSLFPVHIMPGRSARIHVAAADSVTSWHNMAWPCSKTSNQESYWHPLANIANTMKIWPFVRTVIPTQWRQTPLDESHSGGAICSTHKPIPLVPHIPALEITWDQHMSKKNWNTWY